MLASVIAWTSHKLGWRGVVLPRHRPCVLIRSRCTVQPIIRISISARRVCIEGWLSSRKHLIPNHRVPSRSTLLAMASTYTPSDRVGLTPFPGSHATEHTADPGHLHHCGVDTSLLHVTDKLVLRQHQFLRSIPTAKVRNFHEAPGFNNMGW